MYLTMQGVGAQVSRGNLYQRMQPGLAAVVVATLFSFSVSAAENRVNVSLASAYWTGETSQSRAVARRGLLDSGADVSTIYRWFKSGLEFPAEVPVGYLERVREADDGTIFPYVLLVPETYDSSRSYPVDFMLHGGVGRPFPEEPGSWWRRGYDSLRSEEKIVVVPAAWDEAFWWFPNQAENLQEILREVKRRYNVDDNRVYLTGISDGGTGAYFFAFKQHTDWAAFMPYIGHPGVLRNPAGRSSYQLYFENLAGKPLYMVNGEEDPLYPASSLAPFVQVLRQANINHVFRAIEGGGHNTNWLPDEAAAIEQFKLENARDPLPENLQWVTDDVEKFNRNHWVIINQLAREDQPGMVRVNREGNIINVSTVSVEEFTLLLSPDEVNFGQPVAIYINDALRRSERLTQDLDTLLKWVANDRDKSMLFTAELHFRVGD